MSSSSSSAPILVVGATGMTGRHVVHQLMYEKGQSVRVIVRSKDRMMEALQSIDSSKSLEQDSAKSLLSVKEASLLDMTDEELHEQVKGCQAVISCLGHAMDINGMFGHPRRLVTESVKRLTQAMMMKEEEDPKPKFLLMGSNGVAHPAGTDDPRGYFDRFLLTVFRYLLPPHADNEAAAEYVYTTLGTGGTDSTGSTTIEWCVPRPSDLIDGPVTKYELNEKPLGSLFGSGVCTRSNVAKLFVDLTLNHNKAWDTWKFKMPVVHDASPEKTEPAAPTDSTAEKK